MRKTLLKKRKSNRNLSNTRSKNKKLFLSKKRKRKCVRYSRRSKLNKKQRNLSKKRRIQRGGQERRVGLTNSSTTNPLTVTNPGVGAAVLPLKKAVFKDNSTMAPNAAVVKDNLTVTTRVKVLIDSMNTKMTKINSSEITFGTETTGDDEENDQISDDEATQNQQKENAKSVVLLENTNFKEKIKRSHLTVYEDIFEKPNITIPTEGIYFYSVLPTNDQAASTLSKGYLKKNFSTLLVNITIGHPILELAYIAFKRPGKGGGLSKQWQKGGSSSGSEEDWSSDDEYEISVYDSIMNHPFQTRKSISDEDAQHRKDWFETLVKPQQEQTFFDDGIIRPPGAFDNYDNIKYIYTGESKFTLFTSTPSTIL